jgi:drug/metabolite transporter (DMT)-like permease
MNALISGPGTVRLAPWKIGLALAVVYVSWGTTYLAIKEGVAQLPPGLFGGLRLVLAGLVVLAYLAWKGERLALSTCDGFWLWLIGSILFVGGNGLVNVAEKTLPSGAASVLAATTPLWMALLELSLPHGERLTARGWLGLALGLAGVGVLVSGRLQDSIEIGFDWLGPCLMMGSAFCWALGSVLHRRRGMKGRYLVSAAWQMVLGGGTLALLGLACGEAGVIAALNTFPMRGLLAFIYLLVVGSLLGFVAYTWLLGHVSAALAGTYAYVNPIVALLLGWLLASEQLTTTVLVGMVIILAGVGLVRSGGVHVPSPVKANSPAPSTVSAAATAGVVRKIIDLQE